MRRAAVHLTAAALVVWAGTLSAQMHPDFAGKWILQPDKSDMGAGGGGGGGRGGGMRGGGGWGQEFTITQDAGSLKVERTAGGNPTTESYDLTGKESTNTMAMGRSGNTSEVTSTAKWDGSKLVIDSKQQMNMGGNAMTLDTKRVLSLDASGNLVVETTRGGMGGNAPTTTKMVYKKG